MQQLPKVGEDSPQVNPVEILSADYVRPMLDAHTATVYSGDKETPEQERETLRVLRMEPEWPKEKPE